MNPPFSEGLQEVLAHAARDRSFCEDLLARRADAALTIGIGLNLSERAILASVSGEQLLLMIEELGKVAPRAPAPPETFDEPTRGIRPDFPPAPTGIRPDFPPSVACGGIRPDPPGPRSERTDLTPLPGQTPISRGHSSKLPLILGGAVLVGGAIAVGAYYTAGISPDVPRPRAPAVQPGSRPDARPAPASQPTEPAPDAGPKQPKR